MDLGLVITAMVTPMHQDRSVNYEQARRLAAWLLEHGSDALVAAGTTGESPTLTREEKLRLFAAVGEVCRDAGRPLIAGTGSYDTQATVELSRQAQEAGADALLVVTPQYNKPPQEGLFRHFRAVAQAVDIPVIAYNVPSRTSVNLEPATVARLAELGQLQGLKEAGGSLDQLTALLGQTGPDFCIYCGDDLLTLPALALGCRGVISVAAHLIGEEMQQMAAAFRRGDHAAAAALHLSNYPVYKTLFLRTSPIPVKYALDRLGLAAGPCRLPLPELDGEGRAQVDRLLRQRGLI
ncbi:MAG: 4-hydroxy-tetrahydrodipicolinate synthase [Firmicutes bacterium]|nr:4-hydroxy-tetrahydrodipicolinate synthase [Bacillota bacterium]